MYQEKDNKILKEEISTAKNCPRVTSTQSGRVAMK